MTGWKQISLKISKETGCFYMKKYNNFCANLSVLEHAGEQDLDNEFVRGGIIDKFSIQFELTWKLLKELMLYEGRSAARTGSPRDILKEAYATYDFIDQDTYLQMLRDRNDMTHIYNGAAAKELVAKILKDYIPAFQKLKRDLTDRYGDELNQF